MLPLAMSKVMSVGEATCSMKVNLLFCPSMLALFGGQPEETIFVFGIVITVPDGEPVCRSTDGRLFFAGYR